MKKLFLFLLAALILFTLTIYLFVPATIHIAESGIAATTDMGTERFVLEQSQWARWWNYDSTGSAAKPAAATTPFTFNGDVYKLTNQFYKSANIHIIHKNQDLESKLVVIPLSMDSSIIEWKCTVSAGNNPISRLRSYMEAKQIKKNMKEVLNRLCAFLSKNENVYGIVIERTHLKDTLFISSKRVVPVYPSIKEIYELIKKIQVFVASKNCKQSGNPIYNITALGDGQYQLMAGVPVDKRIEDAGEFSLKFMVRGSFMVTEVVGGEYTINKAFKSLQQYFADFRKTSMAINFTMLVTDRQLQPDSSKWITKIYQPVY